MLKCIAGVNIACKFHNKMTSRRSMKRSSPSLKSEQKCDDNVTLNALERKRRKLETKLQKYDPQSAENVEGFIVKTKVESSDSSSDEFMQSPMFDIDQDGSPVKNEVTSDFTVIENNILTGVTRLSDSEGSDFDDVLEIKSVYPSVCEKNAVEIKTDRKKYTSRSSQLKTKVKHRISKSSKRSSNKSHEVPLMPAPEVNKMNVSQLLALGEGSGTVLKECEMVAIKKQLPVSDSENELSDWEDVQGSDTKPTKHVIPKEGIEVTLEMPDLYRKRKKKGFDMEAHLRRRLNRVKRELQVLMHKVHLLGWIAHGRYVNSILNSEVLLAVSLSLIPSQHCYPSKHTNLDYLEQVAKWFKKLVTVKETSGNEPLLPLCESLQQQFQSRAAESPRDLVLMFICVLRALGVKARLILSLQTLSLKPSFQDLCSTNTKKENKVSETKIKSVKSETSKTNSVIESSTSDKSPEKGNECLKHKKLDGTKESSSKLTKSVNDKNGKSRSSKRSKNQDNKAVKARNDTDISDEKMDMLKRNLRTRKEIIKKYKDESNSDDEDYESSRKIKKLSPRTKLCNEENTRKKSSVIDSSVENKHKTKESCVNKSIKVRTDKKRDKSRTTSSGQDTIKEENSDSDFVPESVSRWKSDQNIDTTSKDSGSESEFQPTKMSQNKKLTNGKKLDRRVLSSDSESGDGKVTKKKEKKKRIGIDVWTEVFLEEEEKWISVDVQAGKLHCITELYSHATQPVTYVLAFNNDLTVKDVTCRYCVNFSTLTRKLRVDERWWKESLSPFLTAPNALDREEDEELNRLMIDRPMPTTFKEFKNHPLYVLKEDLLKFEAIYPPDAPALGFIKSKPVYARECVHVLHSREIWMKEAKVVRLGEKPYKIVKARPKFDKMTGQFVKDLPLEVFGFWQVEDYMPPPAVDGKVPRNEYGNVELYKPCMLPKGAVHLQVPGLNRVARKLGIDCAPAVIGFDFHCGGSHPMFDGFVVCEEFKDTLLDAWSQEQDEAEKRQREKMEKRVYGNWRRLIKGLWIRERLKVRYSFGDEAGPSEFKKITSRKPSIKPNPTINKKPVKKLDSRNSGRKQTTKSIANNSKQKGKQKIVHKKRKIESEEETDDDDDDDDDSDSDESDENDSDKDWD